jgi:hypothetical protein
VIDFVSDDYATGSSYVHAFDGANDYTELLIARYDDEYVKQGGSWRFQVRQPNIFKVRPELVEVLQQ